MKKSDINQNQRRYEESIHNLATCNESALLQYAGAKDSATLGVNRTERIKTFGLNTISVKKFNYWKEFFSSFIEPFNLLLLAIGIVELFLFLFNGHATAEMVGFILVFSMVLLATITDFIQEVKSYKINISLHTLVENKYVLLNPTSALDRTRELKDILNTKQVIDQDKITVGDILYFAIGDVIPADCRIIWAKNLTVDQAQLSGESDAVSKTDTLPTTTNFLDYENVLYSQSVVKSGMAIAIVVKVGVANYVDMVLAMSDDQETVTDFDKGISKITKIIFFTILVAFVVILVASGLRTNGKWVDAVMLGISIVVALTPEALPAIISGNLQLGSQILRKHRVVVKNFNIIQNLGSVNVLATDKTGTLTDDKIIMSDFHDVDGCREQELAKLFYLNAQFQSAVTNNIDLGIIDFGSQNDFAIDDYVLVEERQFDYQKRIVSVALQHNPTKVITQITKGSAIEMINIIRYVNDNCTTRVMSDSEKTAVLKDVLDHAEEGKRTIILATKTLQPGEVIAEHDLVYEGLALFDDKIKDGVKQAIKAIYENGIELKILSGDSLDITRNIARKIDLKDENAVIGVDLQEHLKDSCVTINIFSRLNPVQKSEVISCLQENGHVLGYLGDGVNDVLALKLSDVGISVNNGTSAAKQAADIIMLEKDLGVLNNAFVLGRKTFTNALKFIKLTLATNMGLMMTLLITSLWLSFNAMLPIQLLIQNLLYDFSNLVFIFDNVDEVSIREPKKWNLKTFIPYAVFIGLIAVITSVTNFLVMWYGYHMFTGVPSDLTISKIQTMFFLESFITHMMIILVERTERISFIQSNASWKMYFGVAILFLCTIFLVYTPHVNTLFNFTTPMLVWWAIMAGLIGVVWCVGECFKAIYIRITKSWF